MLQADAENWVDRKENQGICNGENRARSAAV